jgi:hypothetical protein
VRVCACAVRTLVDASAPPQHPPNEISIVSVGSALTSAATSDTMNQSLSFSPGCWHHCGQQHHCRPPRARFLCATLRTPDRVAYPSSAGVGLTPRSQRFLETDLGASWWKLCVV